MGKGTGTGLIESRNVKMYERYYYWTEVRRLRFDDALHKLSTEEFFLSESRIMQIIRDMIHAGVTVDGRKIEKPLFTGFKMKARRSSKPLSPRLPYAGDLFGDQ